jgi:hypothetical protein
MTEDWIAEANSVEAFLKTDPDATVQAIAKHVGITISDVVMILDEHQVDDEGNITHEGPGNGGGWHAAREAEKRAIKDRKDQLNAMIEERQRIVRNLGEDAEPGVRESLEEMIADLKAQREELD